MPEAVSTLSHRRRLIQGRKLRHKVGVGIAFASTGRRACLPHRVDRDSGGCNQRRFPIGILIGDTAPDFTADTSTGQISFHDWIGSDWVFFFSHPCDFTPVCTTEIGRTAQLADEFAKRHVKPLGLSTDGVKEHLGWIKDVNNTQNTTVKFPIVADPDKKVARLYEIIHAH